MQRSNYSRYYLLFLSSIFLLIILSQAIIHGSLTDQQDSGKEINVSSTQRTLVQEIAKLALQIRYKNEQGQGIQKEVKDLKVAARRWKESHKALLQGSQNYGLDGKNSPEIEQLFEEVSPVFFEIEKEVKQLIEKEGVDAESSIEAILLKDDVYESIMEKVVAQYTRESSEDVARIRTLSWGLALATAIVLVLAFMFIIRPVLTKLRSQNDELVELNQGLEKVSQIKSDFLANMSHEVRTPLNGILGMADLLGRSSLSSEQQGYVQTIRNSSENLLLIINDILDYSKIESGKMELESEVFDLTKQIEEVIDLLRPTAFEKKLELILYIEPDVPAQLKGDSTRLKQVLINLLNNAIKFTEQGEVLLRVEHLVTEHEFQQLRFSVKDTGIGIDQDKVNDLFQSFTQADTSTTRKYGGTGLGLAICRRIVQMMGGRIWAESEIGKGSTFYFTIIAEKVGDSGDTADTSGLQGLKALIVDDNTTNLKILVKQLSNWGIQATPFNSPELVVEVIDNLKKFDLCILDMQMPAIDGKQLTQEIRKKHSFEDLPVVVLSSIGSGIIEEEEKLWNSYLTKPVRPGKLLSVIREMVGLDGEGANQGKRNLPLEEKELDEGRLSILIAEDNEIHQAVMQRTLKLLGYASEKAYNGHEAMEKIASKDYDMILMDIEMPIMDGFEATQKIRKIYSGKDAPVIIGMSAHNDKKEAKKCLDTGMDDYLPKPIESEVLEGKINEWFPNLNQ